MVFSVQFSPQATRFIRKLDKHTKERIRNKITNLQREPFPTETTRVESYKKEKIFRVRVGVYRILYSVRYEKETIVIFKVDKRSRIY